MTRKQRTPKRLRPNDNEMDLEISAELVQEPSTQPDHVKNPPDLDRDSPESVYNPPDLGRNSPESVHNPPDLGRNYPESVHKPPDLGRSPPEYVHNPPDLVRNAPEVHGSHNLVRNTPESFHDQSNLVQNPRDLVQNPPSFAPKRQRLEAILQTADLGIRIESVSSIAAQPLKQLNGNFKNESESPGLPLILDVYSLSDAQPKQLNQTLQQINNSGFPATPPCSPPLVQPADPAKENAALYQYHGYQQGTTQAAILPGNKSPPPYQYHGYQQGTTQAEILPSNKSPPPYSQVLPRIALANDSRMQCYNTGSRCVLVDNPKGIANGVLPVETVLPAGSRQTMQPEYPKVVNKNTVSYYNSSPTIPSYVSGNAVMRNPIQNLQQNLTPGDSKYLVTKECVVSDGNKLYTRFRLRENGKEGNKHTKQIVTQSAMPQAFPIVQRQNVSRTNGVLNSKHTGVENTSNRSGPASAFNRPMHQHNGEGLYKILLKGYGQNELVHKPFATQSDSPSVSLYQTTSSRNGRQYGTYNGAVQATENRSDDNNVDVLAASERKVQKLKKLLHEQEEALKRLRSNH